MAAKHFDLLPPSQLSAGASVRLVKSLLGVQLTSERRERLNKHAASARDAFARPISGVTRNR